MQSAFITLCSEFFDIVRTQRSAVETDADGAMFGVANMDDVEIHFLCNSESSTKFFTRVEYGPVAQDDELQRWDELLEANHAMFGRGAPSFSRDPMSGHAILQQEWPISISAQDLVVVLSSQVKGAVDWREGRLGWSTRANSYSDEMGAP